MVIMIIILIIAIILTISIIDIINIIDIMCVIAIMLIVSYFVLKAATSGILTPPIYFDILVYHTEIC